MNYCTHCYESIDDTELVCHACERLLTAACIADAQLERELHALETAFASDPIGYEASL